ncbi:MAG TPA: hypothetical protein VHZ55_31400 [Bryobacteraceae bacterium]|jgi:hypothetical protein|nr:hypothetical protein [Bryobacteraceae bacterium]
MRSTVLFVLISASAVPLAGLFGAPRVSVAAVAGQTPAPASAPAPAADITGKWHFVYQTDGGDREMEADFKLDGDKVSGKYGGADAKGTFKDGTLDLAFPYNSEEAGMTSTLKMKGKLKDNKLTGTWQFADYDGTFTATRPN